MGAGRKQAARRASRRTRAADRGSARARFRAKYPWLYADRASSLPNRGLVALGALLAIAFMVLLDALLLHNQIEIARVMTAGRSAQASVTAFSCSGKTADVTVAFSDSSGNPHVVDHASDTFTCAATYHAGDVITIRYAPADPTMLLTQAEINSLPWALALYGLLDILFVIGPPALLAFALWIRVSRG